MTRIDATVGQTADAVTRAQEVVEQAGLAVADVDEVAGRSAGAVDRAEGVISRSETAVGTAERLLGRAEAPLDRLLPLAGPARPHPGAGRGRRARRCSPTGCPACSTRSTARSCRCSRTFENVAPDLHGVLEMVDGLHRLAAGLPGVRRLRKRGDDDVVHSRAEST